MKVLHFGIMYKHSKISSANLDKSLSPTLSDNKSAKTESIQFKDNRPKFTSQKALIDSLNNTAKVKQKKAIQDVSSATIQRQIDVLHEDYQENDGRASHAEAVVFGETLGQGANSPTVDPIGWDEISEKFIMDDVYRMHLWNGRLGGPGDETWNLTPGLSDVNTDMAGEEVNAQAEANSGNIVSLSTDVDYGHSNDDNEPEYYYPSHIAFEWNSQTDDGDDEDDGQWQSHVPLPEVEDMDWDPQNPDDDGLDDRLAW